MEKTISILYMPFGEQRPVSIPVQYETDNDEETVTIRCKVILPLSEMPWWLKPHKFELRALYDGDAYQFLLNETPNIYSVDAALFMDKVQQEILEVEKRKGTHAAIWP